MAAIFQILRQVALKVSTQNDNLQWVKIDHFSLEFRSVVIKLRVDAKVSPTNSTSLFSYFPLGIFNQEDFEFNEFSAKVSRSSILNALTKWPDELITET